MNDGQLKAVIEERNHRQTIRYEFGKEFQSFYSRLISTHIKQKKSDNDAIIRYS